MPQRIHGAQVYTNAAPPAFLSIPHGLEVRFHSLIRVAPTRDVLGVAADDMTAALAAHADE